jgi:hypothetical protein
MVVGCFDVHGFVSFFVPALEHICVVFRRGSILGILF